jgi:HK97 family phage major capsid protein
MNLDDKTLKTLQGPDGKLDGRKLSGFVKDFARDAIEEEAANILANSSGRTSSGRLPFPIADAGGYTGGWSRDRIKALTASTDRAPGKALDGDFRSLGEFAATISPRSITLNGLPDHLRTIQNDMSSVTGADGGYLIPEIMRTDVLMLALENSIVRSRATVLPMDSLTLIVPTIVDTSHASSVFGGVVGGFAAESGTLAEHMPGFGQVKLTARKLYAYTEVPNELIADSAPALEVLLQKAFSQTLAWYEDYNFLAGNGEGCPLGVLNSPALVTAAAESGQTSGTIYWENITKIWARVLPESQTRGVWVASVDAIPELFTMALNVGLGGSAIFMQNGSGSVPTTIFGRPLLFTEKVPKLGSAGDIGFYDFSYYLIGDRQAMSMVSSPHFKFQNDQTAYRLIERIDGQPWVQGPLTPKNGGATLSPFVTLAARP